MATKKTDNNKKPVTNKKATKAKKQFKIKNFFFLSAPLALVVFILRDVICGFNSPGYNWASQTMWDFGALNSFSLVFYIIFTAIFVIIFVAAVYFIWRHFKPTKVHKAMKRGFLFMLILALVSGVCALAIYIPESGSIAKIKEYVTDVTKTETVQSDSQADPNAQNAQGSTRSEEKTVLDEEATNANHEKLSQIISNPLVIAKLVSLFVAAVLALLALVFVFFGGFCKEGILIIGAIALGCLTLFVYGLVSSIVLNYSIIGINTRFMAYAPVIFTAIVGSYIYVNAEVK